MNHSYNVDVIVVGGGPAGSLLASKLAASGKEVLILDKEEFPREKPCGGGLTEKALGILDSDIGPVIEEECYRFYSSYAGSRPFLYEADRPLLYMVQRPRFDHFLLESARAQGAGVLEGERAKSIRILNSGVMVKTKSAEYFGKYVAGADGVAGIVSRSLKIVAGKNCGLAITAKIKPPNNGYLERWRGGFAMDFGVVPRGYGWVFPKSDHFNVGVFTQLQSLSGLRQTLAEYMSMKMPDKGQGNEPTSIHDVKLALIPFGGGKNKLHGPRAVLAGDAACLADPMTGEGIYYALRSATIAANILTKALDTGSEHVISEYSEKIHSEFIADLRASWLISRVYYGFPRFSYQTITHPRVVAGYRKSFAKHSQKGEIPYRRLLRDAISSILFLK